MIAVRRLTAVGAFLGLAAVFTSPRVWGEPKREQELKYYRSNSSTPPVADRRFADELAVSRFAEQSFVVYTTTKGESYFALQLKPKIEASPARPRDYAVLVDISASKAKGPLDQEKQIVLALAEHMGPNDRLAIWSVGNEPKSLTGNRFRSTHDLADAMKALSAEYPSGATNLKKGLASAIASFETNSSRQGVILLLGDGKSLADPVDSDARTALCDEMVKKEIACYTVPVGTRLDPLTLHGLPSGTGGRCVRIPPSNSTKDFLVSLDAALASPVLYPNSSKFGADVTEIYPTRLPPVRSDVPTLVIGKLKTLPKALSYRVEGTVAGKNTVVQAAPQVPVADDDNYFLVGMVNQWREQKDRPALMQADRALAYASERNQLARAELIAKAELALDQGMYSAALKLYEQAKDIDPTSVDARDGVRVAGRMQQLMEQVVEEQSKLPVQKKMKNEQLREVVCKRFADEMKIGKDSDEPAKPGSRGVVVAHAGQAPGADPNAPQVLPVPPVAPPEPLAEVKQRQRVIEEQQIRLTEETIRTANRLVETDPNGARELLKRTIDGIRTNPDLSDRVRTSLGDRVERALASVDRRGALVLREQQEALRDAARVASRIGAAQLEQNVEDRIRERMRVIHELINKAREDEAYKQAEAVREDLVAQGRSVPPAVTAAYTEGLTGYHLREEIELRRLRQEKFLATMLQVEKSAVPFPDEPPVVFPPAAEWKALTDMRKVRYESSTLGAEVPKKTYEIRDALARTTTYDGLDDPRATLQDALDQLSAKYNIQFDINEKAFSFDMVNDVAKSQVTETTPIPKMTSSLGTILRKILSRVKAGNSGATFIIRRDTIEITTGTFATAEKALRVYPAADLVLPIPNSVNQNVVNQAATLFGFAGAVGVQIGVQLGAANAFGIGGLAAVGALGAVGAVGAVGALGALGAVGVQLGALGAVGIQLGALGAVGVQLGALGAVGVPGAALGAGGGFAGVGNQLGVQLGGFGGQFQGAANLGVGGGAAGVGGGQLGQFGNLGGQFGLQGGDQSRILISLIRQVVGTPKDWLPAFDPVTGKPLNSLDDSDPSFTGGENNQVAYFPPSLALVVKGTSRIQTRIIGPITPTLDNNKAADAGRPDRGDRLVRIAPDDARKRLAQGPAKKADGKVAVAGAHDRDGDKPELDPKKIWQDALARGATDPGLIIAVADYLVMNGKFDHAVEYLKADLRQGIVVKPWVYKTLALALRESGGSAEEIERAETAALELEPADAQGYIAASRAMARDKRYDRAVAFCRQASMLEPDVPYPYAEALLYAELAKDEKAMEWAAGNLVKQEWPLKSKELHDQAHQKVESLRRELERSQRPEEARKLVESVTARNQRDLVIKLAWQGDADLDLKVLEPSGSQCSALNRQTVGGGTLVGDTLADMNNESYTAARAYSGEYVVSVERFRGHPLGERAQLRIIQHQGTPEESEQLVSVDLLSPAPVKVRLESGRRTEAAFVPLPSALRPPEPAVARGKDRDVLDELRIAADPESANALKGFSGQVVSPTASRIASIDPGKASEPSQYDRSYYQTKVGSVVKNSLDVTAQAHLSADRRYLHVSMATVSAPATTVTGPVTVSDPVIPGGGN